MRKLLVRYALPFVAAAVLASCDGSALEFSANILSFSLGYEQDNLPEEYAGLVDDSSGRPFVVFPDTEAIEAAARSGHSDMGFTAGTFEFRDGVSSLQVRTSPEKAKLEEVRVVSSDPSVMEVVSVSGRDVAVRCRGVGMTTLSVYVRGARNEMSADFPVHVVRTVELEFFISPYWIGGLNTRLRVRPVNLPHGRESFAARIQDSVSVCGYCEWYDFRKYGSKVQVRRDTVRFPVEDKVYNLRAGRKTFLRNITSAVREFKYGRSVRGSRIVTHPGGDRDTVDHDYKFVVEQVVLDFNLVVTDPDVILSLVSKCGETTDVLPEEEGGDIGDSGVDEDLADNSAGEVLTRDQKAYFVIRPNDFLTDGQRRAQSAALEDELRGAGYDDSLSDDEKDAIVQGLNGGK